MSFVKNDENDLIDTLRKIPIHDSVFTKVEYKDGALTVLLNYSDKKIQMVFNQTNYSVFNPGSDWEGDESIYSFSLIQDPTEIKDLFLLDEKDYLDHMFFMFEMFSGSKFKVVCKELMINVNPSLS